MTRSVFWRHFRLPLAAGACLAALSAVALGVLPQQQGTVDLLTEANVTLNGAAAGDYSGWSVASAGDVNGDGLADVIVGASDADPSSRTNAGSSYVIYGTASPSNVNLASLGSSGFRIDGAAAGDGSGSSVASAGDVNGDGRADLIVGAPRADPSSRTDAGSSYVIYGTASPSNVDLASLGSSGFRIDGATRYDGMGNSVAPVGDINGDGRADVIVGARYADPSLRDDAGSSSVIYGKASPSNVDLASLGSSGFRIDGAAAGDQSGRSVASAGDVNGDGRPDVIVGAPFADPSSRTDAGSSYVIYGFPAASVSYPGAITATVGTPIDSVTPTVQRTGAATFSVSPALPAGLSLDTATGVISGTPTEVATATSTVTMTDLSGTATTTVSVAVAAPPADTPPTAAPTPAAAPAAESPVLTESGGTSTTSTPSVRLSQSQRRNGIPVSSGGDVRITLQRPVGGAACAMTGTFTTTSPAARSGMSSFATTTTLGSFKNVRVPAGSTKVITVRLFATPVHYLQANGATTIGAVLTVRRTLGCATTSSSQKVRLSIPRVHMAVTG